MGNPLEQRAGSTAALDKPITKTHSAYPHRDRRTGRAELTKTPQRQDSSVRHPLFLSDHGFTLRYRVGLFEGSYRMPRRERKLCRVAEQFLASQLQVSVTVADPWTLN